MRIEVAREYAADGAGQGKVEDVGGGKLEARYAIMVH